MFFLKNRVAIADVLVYRWLSLYQGENKYVQEIMFVNGLNDTSGGDRGTEK